MLKETYEIYAAIRDAPVHWGEVSQRWRTDPFGEYARAADENGIAMEGKNKHVKTKPRLSNLAEEEEFEM